MKDRILFVDDEQDILDTFKRILMRDFSVHTATSGREALDLIKRSDPFPVIVSDMRMPEMNGTEFLAEVLKCSPDSVRILLTGFSDIHDTIAVVNRGQIFRFLSKPCHKEELVKNLNDAIEQYRLVQAEKEILEKTLKSSIKLLVEILSIVSPEAFSVTSRLRKVSHSIAARLNVMDLWQVDLAALLSQIGTINIPRDLVRRYSAGYLLTDEEKMSFKSHAQIGKKMIKNIPRLEHIADAIGLQFTHYDQVQEGENGIAPQALLLARILKVSFDFCRLQAANKAVPEILNKMRRNKGSYDPDIFAALVAENMGVEEGFVVREIRVSQLETGMVLADDVLNKGDKLIAKSRNEISETLKVYLANLAKRGILHEPVKVLEWIEK